VRGSFWLDEESEAAIVGEIGLTISGDTSMNVLGRFVGVVVLAMVLWPACGGDDSSGGDDSVTLCKEACGKMQSLCFPDGGGGTDSCLSGCNPKDGGSICTNESDIAAAAKNCLAKTTCQDFLSCLQGLPPCEGGGTGAGGAGGSGGTGGSTGGSGGGGTGGSGGTGGGGSGTCADLLACCNANTNEPIRMACLSGYNTVMGQGDAACGMLLASIKATVCP
jgi:hypothetical protein